MDPMNVSATLPMLLDLHVKIEVRQSGGEMLWDASTGSGARARPRFYVPNPAHRSRGDHRRGVAWGGLLTFAFLKGGRDYADGEDRLVAEAPRSCLTEHAPLPSSVSRQRVSTAVRVPHAAEVDSSKMELQTYLDCCDCPVEVSNELEGAEIREPRCVCRYATRKRVGAHLAYFQRCDGPCPDSRLSGVHELEVCVLS